ncbi:MAG: zinc ribbon domain-containing protein [Planctomycetes bacterium]|nr:zinc ribbon domain-containing protein [Planctomycetota bacterium]
MGDFFGLDDIIDIAFGAAAVGGVGGGSRYVSSRGPVGPVMSEPTHGTTPQTSAIKRLEHDLGRSMLVIQTLLRICQEKGIFNKEEFMAKLQAIDLEDGKRDGQLTRSMAPQACSNCGKPNNHAATTCMYCGGVLKPNSPL